MQIHQFVHALSYGDAISNEAISIARLLREKGVQSNIYSLHVHELLKTEAKKWHFFKTDLDAAIANKEEVAVILHYSIGSPLNDLYCEEKRIKKALIYHNLTPEKWFFPYNARVVADLRKGRAELPELLKHVDIALADSTFNKNELLEFGCKYAEVLPLLIDTAKWSVPANPGIRGVLKSTNGVNILHVGRFAPNKCLEDIIKTFYFYHHKIEKNSKLWLIGSDIDTELYSFELKMLISELRLKGAVEIVGSVADSELKAFYESADAYLCMSEHEGFCVPIIEAMHFGVPIIAFNSSALPETIGNGGMLVSEKRHAEIAELLHLVVREKELREKLIDLGKKKVADYSEANFIGRLNEVLIEPLLKYSPEDRLQQIYQS